MIKTALLLPVVILFLPLTVFVSLVCGVIMLPMAMIYVALDDNWAFPKDLCTDILEFALFPLELLK